MHLKQLNELPATIILGRWMSFLDFFVILSREFSFFHNLKKCIHKLCDGSRAQCRSFTNNSKLWWTFSAICCCWWCTMRPNIIPVVEFQWRKRLFDRNKNVECVCALQNAAAVSTVANTLIRNICTFSIHTSVRNESICSCRRLSCVDDGYSFNSGVIVHTGRATWNSCRLSASSLILLDIQFVCAMHLDDGAE